MPVQTARSTKSTVRKLVPLLLSWFPANARDLPWRRTQDPYAIWVSEIMLQQTQVKAVIPYWERWMRELPTIQTAAKASLPKLHKLWEGLGYYTRVRNLQKAAQRIVAQHGGKFPANFDDILSLPGIGRYTAGAIASIAFNQPRPILDGNVVRALTRIFGIASDPCKKKTNARLWRLAEEAVLHAFRSLHCACACSQLNQSLMELGALVCTPRSPKCNVCPVSRLCVARKQNLQNRLPIPSRRASITFRRFIAFVVERGGYYLVHQRSNGVVNARLWEFPNVELEARLGKSRRAATANVGFKPALDKPLCTIKHSITRYRITLEAYRAKITKPHRKPKGRWFAVRQLHKLAFTGAHKKILLALDRDDKTHSSKAILTQPCKETGAVKAPAKPRK
jgi:A/G-specific adenine glycosylase